MKKLFFLLLASSLILLSSCGPLPQLTNYPSKRIMTAYGPEDIVVDSISEEKDRLLISCASRRPIYPDSVNGIYAMDFEDELVYELSRENEPEWLHFHPHGIDVAMINNQAYLYVINHQDDEYGQNILVYKIHPNKLILDSIIQHPMIVSPNDVFVCNDGGFFFSNDAGVRGSKKEIMLLQKKGSVVYFPPKADPIMIDAHLGMPNGVYFDGDYLWVSTVMQSKLFRFKKLENAFSEREKMAKGLRGGDNINPTPNGLLIPTHLKLFAFMRHVKHPEKHSPTVIYQYFHASHKKEILYCNKGDEISAASTALIYKNKLYISQIFEDFILKVDLPQKIQ